MTTAPSRLVLSCVCAVLAVAAVLPYVQVGSFGFISFDDPGYVRDNPLVNGGLRVEAIGDAFTQTREANWHPLTWLSHMLDCELFGLDPGGHHLMNVTLHALNAVLLLLALRALTGSLWRSALVAALFAVHPLRVESVAWISERKDVLSGTFWMLTLLAYAAYARAPSRARYIRVLVAFTLGLLAKPMLVTLPCVLLLLDVWPLRRTGSRSCTGAGTGTEARAFPAATWPTLVREKSWMLLIGAGVAAATLYAQHTGEAIKNTQVTELGARVLNAFSATTGYISKSLWPVDLAFFYPHPAQIGQPYERAGLLSLGVLVAITLLANGLRTRRPWMLVGWLWFLGTLVPVIGILQVGEQSMADRYTYLPAIGLAIMLAWELGELVRTKVLPMPLIAGACVVALTALGVTAHAQTDTWRDSKALYLHALEVTEHNYTAHSLLGLYYLDLDLDLDLAPDEGMGPDRRADTLDLAEEHLQAALAIEQRLYLVHYNLGNVDMKRGRNRDAEAHYRDSLALRPDNSEAHNNMGIVLANTGRLTEALKHLQLAVECDPDNASAVQNLKSVQAVANAR